MTVQHIAVPNGAIPPLPAGAVATVHSRDLPQGPAASAPQPAPQQQPDPLSGLALPGAPTAQPAAQPAAQPVPAQVPAGIDPTLLNLLAGLTQAQQPAAATAPAQAQPTAQPQAAPGLDGALRGVLSGAGVEVDRALANALEYGDANLIDFAHIREKGGANAAHLEAVARSLVEHAVAEDSRHTASLYARAGGEANFNSAVQAFNASAPDNVKMIVKALTDSGNDAQVIAGVDLMLQYSQGATMQPAGLVQSGAGATLPGGGLSKESFQHELRQLDRSDYQYEQKRQDLYARRAYGKHSGM